MKKSIRKLCAGLLALCMASALMAAAEPANIFQGEIGAVQELNTNPPTNENLMKIEDWLIWSDGSSVPYADNISLVKTVSKLENSPSNLPTAK